MITKKMNEYYLGEKYPGVYFTQREVDCLVQLLSGHTIASAAEVLDLSPRTVEFYVKNMRMKTGVQTKVDLLKVVHDINFVDKISAQSSQVSIQLDKIFPDS